ncbi:TRAP transporter small permease subunit [Labrenzia aggregata]|uniref:TRAP transporter small permease protein n=1 Tax=Roseibium aggregatum TaxID=187304 RepID=A0A926P0M3_9HYPH|nr:TRAP transporter small permease subunit [Roseibium aggregatum]
MEFLYSRAENILALVLASLFVSFLIQIVFRYVLNLPLGWTVEYVSIAWLWGILFGYAFVVKEDDVIRLDIVYGSVPVAVQRIMDVFSGLVCAGIFLWTLPDVWDYVTFMSIERTAYMQIRFDYVFMIYIPFALSVIIRSLISAWHGLNGNHPKYAVGAASEMHDYD